MCLSVEEMKGPDDDHSGDILINLSRWTDFRLDRCLKSFLEKGILIEPMCFRLAGADIRDYLISKVDTSAESLDSIILFYLAWIGDIKVMEFFDSLRKLPPKWGQPRFVANEVTWEANWTLKDGHRKDLYFPVATQLEDSRWLELSERIRGITTNLEKIDHPHPRTSPYFASFVPTGKICPWCHTPEIHLFEIDSAHFGIPAKTDVICVPMCENCICAVEIHGYENEGQWIRNPQTPEPKGLTDELPKRTSRMRLTSRIGLSRENSLRPEKPVKYCSSAGRLMENTSSRIGGMPTWMGNAKYPTCLKCHELMMFLGQSAKVDLGKDGFIYAFICLPCSTTATLRYPYCCL